jgi:hypothetical protein|nr:MAG TPA: hypothetical protein [Caudoviricetes sp.]
MIFFDYYFKASSTPKYLDPVVVCMERRYQALIADEQTLKKFIAELKSELDAIPKAKGRYKIEVDKGYIHIITVHEFSEAVIRLQYKEVFSLEGFSEELSKSLNEVAEKGGEK